MISVTNYIGLVASILMCLE